MVAQPPDWGLAGESLYGRVQARTESRAARAKEAGREAACVLWSIFVGEEFSKTVDRAGTN